MQDPQKHPWQNGPRELFEFAIDTLRTDEDVNQRVAFLLLDVCVETTLRTYLSLPDGISGSPMSYFDRRKYSGGKFHELTKGVSLSAKGQVADTDLHHLNFYHYLRNHLYHQGNGISVRSEYVHGYAALARTLLKQLLDIDFNSTAPQAKQDAALDQDAFNALKKDFRIEFDRLKHLINDLMELTEPRMLYPSAIRTLAAIRDFNTAGFSSFPKKVQEFRNLIENNIADKEFRSWFLDLLADDLSSDDPQVISNTEFFMYECKDPISFYAFIIGIRFVPMEDVSIDTIDRYDDISYIGQREYSLMGLYNTCQAWQNHESFGLSDSRLFEILREYQSSLVTAITRLEEVRSNLRTRRAGERDRQR